MKLASIRLHSLPPGRGYQALVSTALLTLAFLPGCAWSAAAAAGQPREGWYPRLIEFAQVRENVDIPPKKGVLLVDSRPAARQFDPGHIPGAINIPDTQFEKLVQKLPEDRATQLIFYCGGLECMLSHNSAFKAEKLGYSQIRVYAAGMPDWKANGGTVAISMAQVRKLIEEKAAHTLIDARPKRVADKGMIPTAINIPDTEFDRNVDKLPADKSTLLVYYCGGLECVLSEKSADKARKLGYTNVVTYPEGYPEWEKAHGAAVAGPSAAAMGGAAPAATAATLQPGKEKGSVSVASFQQVWREAPTSLMLVDVRDPKEFAAGAARGSVNLPINDLEKKADSLPADKPVVFICGTGARSGEAYDLVKMLRPQLKAFFLDADTKFAADGSVTISEKK
ncbi:rhodanese-like domain-containing protein [Sphaerotilus microaerophilus]|uniref:Rhodanese domain-containing protein n=1 Tax=Sphaerotilus microaerophilus TaxID=2914710 RepID=A0ABM7YRY5_9BURK|nr:rhodanese-like domain-containing protein [Sphaerotilus sp. FB-5]BDI07356.1 hypothetical protein CATMQ487_43260 [Sphaerotilus sp. FB-5]